MLNIEDPNSIIVVKIGDKYYLKMYINWELKVLTYVSPWVNDHKTPRTNRTYTTLATEQIRVSKKYEYAAMPLSIKVTDNWIFIHYWKVNWEPLSHWCIRVPLYYQTEIFKLAKEYNAENSSFKIKIWNL